MSSEPQLFRVNPDDKVSERIEEVDFALLGLQERRDIQEWVAANPGILGDDLLIIGKEFSGFDRTNERLDLLAVDSNGKLVIVELKRDDTGADAHWQAIKYASYLHKASADDIIGMMSDHTNISGEEAANRLLQHLGADDLNALNNDQRIILASHRFAPEVTSAALWLNEKVSGENLITCVKLTPHRDAKTDSLYIQASTIIPVPGVDEYIISVGSGAQHTPATVRSRLDANLKATFDRNRNDEVTHFLRDKVSPLVLDGLPDEIRPDRTSRWAGAGAGGNGLRYYHFWYTNRTWSNRHTPYSIRIWREEGTDTWGSRVGLRQHRRRLNLEIDWFSINLDPDLKPDRNGITVDSGSGVLDDNFASRLAEKTRGGSSNKSRRNWMTSTTRASNDIG